MIECRTLGTWELKVNGKPPPVELAWRKNFGLLVYLARSPRRTRSRDHLIGLLWADKPEHDARRSLNVALSTLRQSLGADDLVTDQDRVRLAAGAVEVDVERFDYLVGIGDLKGATEHLAHGAEFLAGFVMPDAAEFENWLLAERTSVRRRAVDVLTRRATELLDLGRTRDAQERTDQALVVDDMYEPAVRGAMQARARCHDRAGALSLYEAFKARLLAQVGAAPDAETEALARRLQRDGARAHTPVPSGGQVAAGEPARRAPLEDRAESLKQLLGAWRACAERPCRTIMIVEGDPGMGKTRLVEELTVSAQLDGAHVAAIRAVEADLVSPWSGVRALCQSGLSTAPGAAGASPEALGALRAGGAASDRIAPALHELVQAVCEEQPLVLVLDDAQWADRESLVGVLATLRDPTPAPLTIIVAITRQPPPRPEIEDLRSRLGREVEGTVVRLGPLSLEAIRRMARWALPQDQGVPEDEWRERVARRVAADSAGLPLLAVALLDAIVTGLELGDEREGWPRPGQTLDQTFPGDLPDNVVGAIRVMFGRASADAQKVLVALAVLGNRVPAPTLGRGSELSGDKLTAALEELEWKQWVTAEPRGYGFVARIFGDVVNRDMVSLGQRLRIRELAGVDQR